jgi:hypothetical protein
MDKPYTEDITTEEVIKRTSNHKLLNIVSMLTRPGAMLFATRLEYDNYPPGSPFNDNFQFYMMNWGDIPWVVISIPIEDRPKVDKLLDELKLRLGDGIPTMITSEGVEQFPVQWSNTFSLENRHDHPIHCGTPDEEYHQTERSECEKIHSSYARPSC